MIRKDINEPIIIDKTEYSAILVNNSIKESINELCSKMYQGQCVLIIGPDIILNEGYGEGNSRKYLEYKYKEFVFNSSDDDIINNGSQYEARGEFLNTFEFNMAKECNKDLYALFKTRLFRFVLVTTYDSYVEEIMQEVWKCEINVINIFDNETYKKFAIQGEDGMMAPTLCYVFGKAVPRRKGKISYEFNLNDNDAIKAISEWIRNPYLSKIVNFISKKNILALGCKLDDWQFRFMWYSLQQNIKDLSGNVAISLTDSESDIKLKHYLKKINVEDNGESRLFLKNLLGHLYSPETSVFDELSREEGSIFISYAKENFNMAMHLYNILHGQELNVWIDEEELSVGDYFDFKISEGINKCKIFIALLSGQTKMDIEGGRKRYYSSVEWESVKQINAGRASKKEQTLQPIDILPIAIDGFDPNLDAMNLIENYKMFDGLSILKWGKDSDTKLLQKINTINNQ